MESFPFIEAIESGTPLVVTSHRLVLDGWDNLVVEVNGEYIFRFTRREDVLAQHLKELELLPVQSESLSMPVPVPEFSDTSSAPYFMGYRKIPGEPLRPSHVNNGMIDPLSRFLRELQRIPVGGFHRVEYLDPEAWKAQYVKLFNSIEEELSGKLGSNVWARIQNLFRSYLDDPDNFMFTPIVSHRDLSGDHILHQDGEITGVIDWGDACIGDPAFDLTGLMADFGRGFAEQLCKESSMPVSYLDRCEFYVRVIPFHRALHWAEMGKDDRLSKELERIEASFG